MQTRNFSVRTEDMERGTIVMAVSDDLMYLLVAVDTAEGDVRLRRIRTADAIVTGVYFGTDDLPWSGAFRPDAE